MFIILAFSFAKPHTGRDWRSFGAFSAFLVALFTEMYGFPLTIYLLSGWIVERYLGLERAIAEDGAGREGGTTPSGIASAPGRSYAE